jgi:hypothetical protein
MTNLHPVVFLNQLTHLVRRQGSVSFDQPAKSNKFIVRYIGPILLGE